MNQITNYDRTEDTGHGDRFDSVGEAVAWILGIIGLLFVVVYGFYSVTISDTKTTTVQTEIVDTEHHDTAINNDNFGKPVRYRQRGL